jgi:hypothetical protein
MLAQHEKEELCQLIALSQRNTRLLCAISVKIRHEKVLSPSSKAKLRKKPTGTNSYLIYLRQAPVQREWYFKAGELPKR